MGNRVLRVIVTRYTVQRNIPLFEYQVKKQTEGINNNEVIRLQRKKEQSWNNFLATNI